MFHNGIRTRKHTHLHTRVYARKRTHIYILTKWNVANPYLHLHIFHQRKMSLIVSNASLTSIYTSALICIP